MTYTFPFHTTKYDNPNKVLLHLNMNLFLLTHIVKTQKASSLFQNRKEKMMKMKMNMKILVSLISKIIEKKGALDMILSYNSDYPIMKT